ncbi:MAG: hypothetical protein OK442_06995 [Thaumarchaeota archaeon]|nr:hypothetical protein [Nitrososphaerota archaeon]
MVSAIVSIGLALGIWAALGALDPGQAGFGSQGVGASRGLVLIAVGVFALTTAAWSRLRSTIDSEL